MLAPLPSRSLREVSPRGLPRPPPSAAPLDGDEGVDASLSLSLKSLSNLSLSHSLTLLLSCTNKETAIARHRASLVGAGLLEDASEAWLAPRREQTLAESEAAFEVLAEIFAAQTRVDVCPASTATRLATRTVRARAAAPPLTDDESLRAAARAAAGYGAAGLLALPRLPVRPRYWDALGGGGGASPPVPPLPPPSPAVADAARRGVAVGARALVYGAGAGLVGAALAAVLAARAAGVAPGVEDGGGALRAALAPVASAARGAAEAVRDAVGVEAAAAEGSASSSSSFSAQPPPGGEFAASLAGRLDGQRRRLAARVARAGLGEVER